MKARTRTFFGALMLPTPAHARFPTPVASSGALQQSRKHFKTRMKTRLMPPWAVLPAPAPAFAIPTEEELSP